MRSFQSRGRQKDVSALHEYLTECVWPSPVLKRWRFSCLICFLPEWVLPGFPGWWPSYPQFSGWMLLWLRAEILQVRTRWFLSGVHADTGREAFPLQVQPPVQTGSSSGFRESSFSQKSFPSRFTTWNGPAGKGLPVPEPLIQRKGDRLLAQGPYGIDGHLENCEKLRQAENSHFLSARSLMIVTASICDCFFMHIRTWLLHLTFLSLCNMVRLYQVIWQTGEIECVMPILRLPGTYAYWYLSSWEVKLCKHEVTVHSKNIFIKRKQDTAF